MDGDARGAGRLQKQRECEYTCFTIAEAMGCGRSMKNL
jgi:hypothetical protein